MSTPTTASCIPDPWQPALAHSRFLRHLLEARPPVADWVAANAGLPVDGETMRSWLAQTPATDDEMLKASLRGLRQRVMASLIVRDLTGAAPLAEVVETMTILADVTTNHALDFIHRQLVVKHGEPLDGAGHPQRLMVIGMGKLGGRELNVSSDVDYIFIYPEEMVALLQRQTVSAAQENN